MQYNCLLIRMMSVNRLLKIVKQEAKYEYKPTIKVC